MTTASSKMDEKISKLFLPIVDKLFHVEPAGEPFRYPVDPEKYQCWDYYHYVKHPIDLTTIRNKLISLQYKDAWRCVTDLNLMFANAYVFNKRGTPVYEWATKLNKIWNNELANVMPRLNYCCGALYKFGPQLLFCHGTTPDRYCQISIGAKYKCYKDSYSFCSPCFNKIDSNTINLQELTLESTSRMKLPTQSVKKSDFADCTNDKWQYERFIQCNDCQRRIHQICDLYPADEDEIELCLQHETIEEEQKAQCCIPSKFLVVKPQEPRGITATGTNTPKIEIVEHQNGTSENHASASSPMKAQEDSRLRSSELQLLRQSDIIEKLSSNNHINGELDFVPDKVMATTQNGISGPTNQAQSSLDDDLLRYARVVEDMHSLNPSSPNPDENILHFDGAKESNNKNSTNLAGDMVCATKISRSDTTITTNSAPSNVRNSVDDIAARLSSNRIVEIQVDVTLDPKEMQAKQRDKYVCNHCYKKDQFGFNLRHRKYSARRIPHTRMSRYIETKVNEYIRQNSPSAGEMTVRVLTAYRDIFEVMPEMKEYLKHCKTRDPSQHPNLDEYPDQFEFTTRAIFAWQEIDGIDVCVFGMHVQEYGDDCPEPNKRVVYLSYLDSVHFFRPKQFRTAVYHEILLSYFKYVKKLGFRRVFIWVCPSRKGDDYIFYRHPTEQKMPTLKRLSDWYVHLLDKGCTAGIIERYQNIHEYATSDSVTSVLSMPYLNGDYWPGEFERLLKIMIESQKIYEEKSQNQEENNEQERADTHDISNFNQSPSVNYTNSHTQGNRSLSQKNTPYPSLGLFQETPSHSSKGKLIESANLCSMRSNSLMLSSSILLGGDDLNSFGLDDSKFLEPYTPSSAKSDDQPLDLSKSNSTASPESCYDDELSFEMGAKKRRRKPSATSGYTKKRGRIAQNKPRIGCSNPDGSKFGASQKNGRKSSSLANKDASTLEVIENPEQELIRNLERSFKRQKDGFMVVHLRECDCLPHYENQRRKEEVYFACDLMKGREPFLHLARQMNYEFSTIRRAKFSSLAMVKHLGASLGLAPICKACYSFDSSKRHYYCSACEDFYLCTSCQESVNHKHFLIPMQTASLPDISEFLQECAPSPATNSISSASSTISNKSYNDNNLESTTNPSKSPPNLEFASTDHGAPLHRHLSNAMGPTPLSCKKQRNRGSSFSANRAEDEENSKINPFASGPKLGQQRNISPRPSHSSDTRHPLSVELDQMLVHNIMRQAQLNFDVDFDEMKGESKKLLSHYWECPNKDSCPRCKFVVLSCSFMSAMLRSPRFQMIMGNPERLTISNGETNNVTSVQNDGINLTKSDRQMGLG